MMALAPLGRVLNHAAEPLLIISDGLQSLHVLCMPRTEMAE
jgi:hypothetical protein